LKLLKYKKKLVIYTSMEATVVEHFQRRNEIAKQSVILSCSHISKATGLKQRQVFALLNKSSRFTPVDGDIIGYWGERYNFFSLADSQ
jgi:hypothetical protein